MREARRCAELLATSTALLGAVGGRHAVAGCQTLQPGDALPCAVPACLQGRAKRGELRYLESAQAYFDDVAHFDEISRMCSYTHPRVWQDNPGALLRLTVAVPVDCLAHTCHGWCLLLLSAEGVEQLPRSLRQ